MAWYKYPDYVKQINDAGFDDLYRPGVMSIFNGIYKCQGCGKEILHPGDTPLPNHSHLDGQSEVKWRIIVWAPIF